MQVSADTTSLREALSTPLEITVKEYYSMDDSISIGHGEGSHLAEYEWILFPREASDKVTAMFAAYLDESADQYAKKIFAVGAFLGRSESWAKVEWRWKELLKEYGLEYYRAVEAEHARGQFNKLPYRTASHEDLSFEQKEMLRNIRRKFLALATNGTLAGLVIGVDMVDFEAVTSEPAVLEKFGATPYYFCYHMAMLTAVEAIKTELRSKELVAFICDQNQQFSSHLLKVHSEFCDKNPDFRNQIGSLSFDDKRRFIGLQLADTLVYEGRKCLEVEIDNSQTEEREELRRLKESHSIYKISLCQRPCLEDFLRRV